MKPCPFIYMEHLIYRLNCHDWGYSVGKPQRDFLLSGSPTPLNVGAPASGQERLRGPTNFICEAH